MRYCNLQFSNLVDVILTNRPTSCGNICNFDCGISDVHNIISVQFKSEMPQKSKSKRLFRSYKNFDNAHFIKDLNEQNLDFSKLSDVNLAYDNFNHQFTEVYDKHVPLKKRSMVKSPVPYMDSKLRKAVYKKRQLHNVF